MLQEIVRQLEAQCESEVPNLGLQLLPSSTGSPAMVPRATQALGNLALSPVEALPTPTLTLSLIRTLTRTHSGPVPLRGVPVIPPQTV